MACKKAYHDPPTIKSAASFYLFTLYPWMEMIRFFKTLKDSRLRFEFILDKSVPAGTIKGFYCGK